jgi:hypothetical protein
VDPIQPIAPDRSVQRVDLTYLTPLEREREKQRREERRRRQNAPQAAPEGTGETPADSPSNRGVEPNSGIDVRA